MEGHFLVLSGTVPSFRARNGTQAVPYGFAGGGDRSSARVIYATWHGGAPRSESKSTDCRWQSHLDSIDESSPPYCAIPFIYTDSAPYLRYFRIMEDAELDVDKQGVGGYD